MTFVSATWFDSHPMKTENPQRTRNHVENNEKGENNGILSQV